MNRNANADTNLIINFSATTAPEFLELFLFENDLFTLAEIQYLAYLKPVNDGFSVDSEKYFSDLNDYKTTLRALKGDHFYLSIDSREIEIFLQYQNIRYVKLMDKKSKEVNFFQVKDITKPQKEIQLDHFMQKITSAVAKALKKVG